jgi:hypothetical protein
LLVGGLVLGLVAVGTVDGLVVSDRRAEARRQAAHDRLLQDRQSYLDALRSVAHDVRRHLLPVDVVLNELSSPHTGDIVAVRDALANPEAVKAIGADLKRVEHLRTPAGWESHQTDLRRALEGVHSALSAMRGRRSVDDLDSLTSELQVNDQQALWHAITSWREGLSALFVVARAPMPETLPPGPPPPHVEPSVIGWVFRADRLCIKTNLRVHRLLPRVVRHPPDLQAFRQLGVLLGRTSDGLRDLAAPPTPRLRHDVLGRLTALDSLAKAAVDLADRAAAGDQFGAGNALDRLRTAVTAARGLASGFRHFHAIPCAATVSAGAGKRHRALDV